MSLEEDGDAFYFHQRLSKRTGIMIRRKHSPSLEEEGEVTKSIIQHHRPLRETVMGNEDIIIFPSLSLEEDGDA